MSELDNTESSAIITEFIQLLPVALYSKSVSEKLTKANFAKVLRLYKDDIPCSRSLDTELDLWEAKCDNCEEARLAKDINTSVKALPHAIILLYKYVCHK